MSDTELQVFTTGNSNIAAFTAATQHAQAQGNAAQTATLNANAAVAGLDATVTNRVDVIAGPAITQASTAAALALAALATLSDYVSGSAAMPRNPTTAELTTYPGDIKGSRTLASGATQPLLWDRTNVVWRDNGSPGATKVDTDAAKARADLAVAALPAVKVASVAALRARTNDGSPVQTLGYAGALSGGAGVYDPDPADSTSADNGGTVLVGVGGTRYKLRLAGQVSPRQFGAVGDGVADDRPALQACLTAANALKIPIVTAPQDTYLLKTFTGVSNKALLYVYGQTRLSGGGLIKVDASVGAYQSLFLQAEALSDIRFGDIKIDCGLYAITNTANQEDDPRRTFNFSTGTSASFIGTTIVNWTGVQLFCTNGVDKVLIDHCTVSNAGINYNSQDFDSSMVYANGSVTIITNNTFSSANSLGVRTCIEVHGKSSLITGNTVRRFKASVIVASDLTAPTPAMESALITGNQFYEVASGLYVWAIGGRIKALTFTGNTVTIDRTLGGPPNLAGGMAFYTLNTYPIGTLTFTNNTVEFLSPGATYLADDDTDGLSVDANGQVIDNLIVGQNTFLNPPVHGMSIRFAKIGTGSVTGNTVTNAGGYAGTGVPNRAGVYLVGNTYNGQFTVDGNILQDTRATTAMTHGVLHFGVSGDNASNLRIGVNSVTYVGTAGVTVGASTTAPVLQNRAYSTLRPGVGTAYSGNFAEGSTVTEDSSGTVYRQVAPVSGQRWVAQRSEKLPVDGSPAFQGDRHTNPTPVAGGSAGLVCVQDGVAAGTPWAASTVYSMGQFVSANGKSYYVKVGGTSGTTAPSHTSGDATNGGATFTYYGINAIYKSFATIAA